MKTRLIDILALAPALVDEAKRNGNGVNESYFLVHRVLAEAFKEDLARIPAESLRAHMSARLKETLAAA